MRWKISNWRVWVFRGLVIIAALIILASFIMPWWAADFGDGHTVNIYGWGLRHSLGELASYVAKDITPFYQTVIAWVYLIAGIGLILFSTFIKDIKGKLLLGSIGLIHIIYVVIAVFVVITNRIADFSILLQGYRRIWVAEGVWINVTTSLQCGYYLAYIAGGMCIALALLRSQIVSRTKKVYT